METRMVAQSQVASPSGSEQQLVALDVPAVVPVIDGEVRWYHVSRSRAVRRILERSIARWVESHHLIGAWTGARGAEGINVPRYRAVFQREGDGHYVHCQIEVVAGTQAWMGSRVGRGIQQALADCLAHMTLRPLDLNGGFVGLPQPQPATA